MGVVDFTAASDDRVVEVDRAAVGERPVKFGRVLGINEVAVGQRTVDGHLVGFKMPLRAVANLAVDREISADDEVSFIVQSPALVVVDGRVSNHVQLSAGSVDERTVQAHALTDGHHFVVGRDTAAS